MLLTRLQVAELRQFGAAFELAQLGPGLNIFSGANEAGKSTLVRAIRAAFFERHRSTSVDDLRPFGDSAAAPTVALDFEIKGVSYRLNKSFLHKKRCELMIGTRRLEGVEAEDTLAELLGFQFAPKGASREEHWGVPGLLWIEQGSAQALRHAVLHAADHLRKVLDESLGEVSASGGDELVAQVRKQRDELLTGTGKPKAAYAKAIDHAAALAQRATELQQAVALYRGQVDQLLQNRDEQAAELRQQPWLALREQQAQAQQALLAAEALADQRQRGLDQLRQASGLRDLLGQRLTAAEQQQQGLVGRDAALVAAAARLEQAGAVAEQAVLAEAAAAERWRLAREALTLARQEDNRALLRRQAADAQQRALELASLQARASAETERALKLKREAAPLRIAPADLARLRQQQTQLGELQIRQAAVATRLRFALDAGVTLDLGGETISAQTDNAQTERLLLAPTTLTLPGLGQIHIAPGGADLTELAQSQASLGDEHRALLQRLGLAGVAEAEARDKAHGQRLADADAADKARQLLAPQGLDALQAELDAALSRQTEAGKLLAQLPAAGAEPAPPLSQAEGQQGAARQAAETASRQLQAARQALATAASQHQAARQEREALKAELDDPQRLADLTARRAEWLAAGDRVQALQADITAIDQHIVAARLDILRQDVERFRRSADEAERQRQGRELQRVQLETALAAAGAQGLEEALSRANAELAQAQRRLAELQRRAEALDYLLQQLEQRRQALTRRLQAPLQQHLDRYLRLLFADGRLDVDEQLLPGALSRSGLHGPEVADFETLSFGAREQLGVISRLAYADLLKAAGRPTLIILDDALVHSDEHRLTQMKRVLFDAAQRHQVLLFTCHPAQWRDMGVAIRSLEAERAAAT